MTIQYNLLKKYILILFGIGLCILILFVGITLYILPSGVVPKMIYENNKEEGFPGVYLLGLPNDYDMQKSPEEIITRGAVATYNLAAIKPTLGELQLISKQSLKQFEECLQSGKCYREGGFEALTTQNYNKLHDALRAHRSYQEGEIIYKPRAINTLNFFVFNEKCVGDRCFIRRYLTFFDDIAMVFTVMMNNEDQSSVADALAGQLKFIKSGKRNISSSGIVTDQNNAQSVIPVSELSLIVGLPDNYTFQKNIREQNRGGSFISYDFRFSGDSIMPYLSQIRFFTSASIKNREELCQHSDQQECSYDGRILTSDRFLGLKNAFVKNQDFQDKENKYLLQTIRWHKFLVSNELCSSGDCVIRWYVTFSQKSDTTMVLFVRMANASQSNEADALVSQMVIPYPF